MSQPARRGPIARFFIGIWDAMNFTRRLILNLLFFFLLFLFIAILGSGERLAPLHQGTALVIAPEGRLVEQYTTDPFTRALTEGMGQQGTELQLRDLLAVLDHAAKDDNIERVVLELDGLGGGGMASWREVAAAVDRVREAGKEVVAFSEGMSQGAYLAASRADELYIDPMGGGVLLEGFAGYRQYYREGLEDKLGVDIHLFKVGEYKSAAEPFVLDAASPESKEADLYWMNDLWRRYLADVGEGRGLDPARLAADAATLPAGIVAAEGDVAQYAVAHGLADGLMTREQFGALMAERGVADEDAEYGYRQVSLRDYLAHLQGTIKGVADPRPQVAVIVASGPITGGDQPPGTVGGESTSKLLREAREDENVRSVVLRVSSPGGGVFPSEQIRREVVALQEAGKPVVVSMGDVAASGGYWISMDAERIYADPSTITGSIGIFGMFPTLPRALDKMGIHTDGVGTTPFAGAFDVTRPLDPQVGTVIQSIIEKGYRDFTGKVAQARGRSIEQIDEVARGRVWSGAQALDRGLVDELGYLVDAVAHAASLVELGEGDYRVRYIEKQGSPFEQWMGGFASTRLGMALLGGSDLARGLVTATVPGVERDLALFRDALARDPGVPVKTFAHCLCDPEGL